MIQQVRMPPARGRPKKDDSRQSITPMELVQKIDGLIAVGSLIPGQRLVESDLMAEFGASRGIVREALRFLAGDGVVEILPNKGVRISRIERERIPGMLEVYGGLFRLAVELLVSRPLKPDAIAALKNGRDMILAAAKSRNKSLIVDSLADYNEIVVRYSGNDYLPDMLRKMHYRHYVKQQDLQADLETMLATCSAYIDIHESILRRDAESASRTSRRASDTWLNWLQQFAP